MTETKEEYIAGQPKQPTPAPRVPADLVEILRWSNVIHRLISVSKSGGYSIVTIRVLVDNEGVPLHYSAPTSVKLEPRADSAEVIAQFITAMST